MKNLVDDLVQGGAQPKVGLILKVVSNLIGFVTDSVKKTAKSHHVTKLLNQRPRFFSEFSQNKKILLKSLGFSLRYKKLKSYNTSTA